QTRQPTYDMCLSTHILDCLLTYFVVLLFVFFLMLRRPSTSTLFPYTTLFRSCALAITAGALPATSVCFINCDGSRRFSGDSESRSEEHTSELQSRFDLVCRLLLEKKNR